MKPYHPDDSGMVMADGHGGRGGNNDGNGGGNNGGQNFRVVMPVETRLLARDMMDEFGGTLRGWRRNIRQPAPAAFNFGGGGGNGGGKGKPDGQGGEPGDNDDKGGFEPSRPHNASQMSPMTFPLGFEPTMPAAQPMQTAQSRQALTPEMMAIIRASLMRG